MSRDRIAGLALILVAGFVAFETRSLPFGSLASPGPGYWPMVLSGALALFGAATAALGGAVSPLAGRGWSGAGKPVAILAGCGFVALALEPLGYRTCIAIFVVFLLGIVERRRPLTVLGCALLLAFGTHYLIDRVLGVPLPRGPWEL
jgi:hypothetical protein